MFWTRFAQPSPGSGSASDQDSDPFQSLFALKPGDGERGGSRMDRARTLSRSPGYGGGEGLSAGGSFGLYIFFSSNPVSRGWSAQASSECGLACRKPKMGSGS